MLVQCDTNTDLNLYIYVSDLYFIGPVILLYILKTICWTNAIIGILVPCDKKIYLIKCMWIVTYISWPSDFVLYLED